MKQDFRIKDFQDCEAGEIYAIIRYIYNTSEFMSDEFDRKFPSLAEFIDQHSELLNNKGSFLQVAIFEEKPVGYLVLEINPAKNLGHTATLTMGVVENLRGIGVGKFLLNEALARAKIEGLIEIIYLMVRSDHNNAVQLYQSAGFTMLAKLEKDTKIGDQYFDGLLMRKFI